MVSREGSMSQIISLDNDLNNPKALALERMKLLEGDARGFPAFFVPLLEEAVNSWIASCKLIRTESPPLSGLLETDTLIRILRVCKRISQIDQTLNDELGREGSHVLLSKLIKLDVYDMDKEEDRDTMMEVQDIACEVASLSKSFPIRAAPLTVEDLKKRLPLSFPIVPAKCKLEGQDDIVILINQVTERQSAQKDVGFVMWPSAVALSRWMVSNPKEIEERSILELGAGCGLVGLVAALMGAPNVTLTDFNEIVVKNLKHNILLNGVEELATSAGLDFYKQDTNLDGWLDIDGVKRPQVDLILASDIICQPDDAYAAARSIYCALRPGGIAIIVSADSKHRFGVECFENACKTANLEVLSTPVKDLYDGELICNEMEKTSGFVGGMELTMYKVTKATQ